MPQPKWLITAWLDQRVQSLGKWHPTNRDGSPLYPGTSWKKQLHMIVGIEHCAFWRPQQVMSPTLHLSLHEIVANQIWDGEPEVTWRTAERLTAVGYERHDVLHMIVWVVGVELQESLRDRRLHRPDLFAKGLKGLPASWEALRPDSSHGSRKRRGRH